MCVSSAPKLPTFFLKNVFETIREAKCKKKNKKIKNKTKRNQRLLAASFPAFKWKTKTINTGRVSFPSLPSFYRVFFGFFGHWGHRAAPVNERALRRPRNFQTKRNAKIQRFPDVIWCREMSHATVGRRFLLFLFDFFFKFETNRSARSSSIFVVSQRIFVMFLKCFVESIKKPVQCHHFNFQLLFDNKKTGNYVKKDRHKRKKKHNNPPSPRSIPTREIKKTRIKLKAKKKTK